MNFDTPLVPTLLLTGQNGSYSRSKLKKRRRSGTTDLGASFASAHHGACDFCEVGLATRTHALSLSAAILRSNCARGLRTDR
jgi:hypothetical protein